MSFIMKMISDVVHPPSRKGNQYTFQYGGPDLQFQPGQCSNIGLGYQLNQLPEGYSFEMNPHSDLLNMGFSAMHRILQPDDYGTPITCPIRLGQKQAPQKIRSGHNLFSGILKSISDVGLDVLPFLVENQNQNKMNQEKQNQKGNNQIKIVQKKKKIKKI